MSSIQKNRPLPSKSARNSGLLDAYTDEPVRTSTNFSTGFTSVPSSSSALFVSKKNKNKNKRKRNQHQKEQEAAETVLTDVEDQVIDSWEDLVSADEADDELKPESLVVENVTKHAALLKSMEQLMISVRQAELKLHSHPETSVKEAILVDMESESKHNLFKDDEKSRENIMAEREAKRAAKALAKQNKASKIQKPVNEIKCDKASLSKMPHASIESAETTVTNCITKSQLKKQRREKQEADRAAKKKEAKLDQVKEKEATQKQEIEKCRSIRSVKDSNKIRREGLFSHLQPYRDVESQIVNSVQIHPALIKLSLRLSRDAFLIGSNSKCVALLVALHQVISDFKPIGQDITRDLDALLEDCIQYLAGIRPLSISMTNIVRYLKNQIISNQRTESIEMDWSVIKTDLMKSMEDYVHINIVLAAKQISLTALRYIRDNDVILTYGWSSLVCRVLVSAFESGKKIRVIVADSRPRFEGRELVQSLLTIGIPCTYILVSAISYIIKEVSKVFIGADAVLANGGVISSVGTSQLALVAKAVNVPVLVCCETYKFSERSYTDSFVFNELLDPEALSSLRSDTVNVCRNQDVGCRRLTFLNLNYDLTPAAFVDVIITELSVIPCTSAPVVLRLKADSTY